MKTRLRQFTSTDLNFLFSPWRVWLLLFGSLVSVEAWGQTKAWDKTIGGNNNDALTALQQTRDGGYILGGSSFSISSGDKTGGNQGACDASFCSNDYWLVKLDADGNKLWDKTLGGSTADFFTSLQQTQDGGYVLGGYSGSNSSGDKTQDSRGSYDYWVVKLDADGNKLWDKTYGSRGTDILTSLQQTLDGGYILGGSSPPGRSGDKTGNSQGNYDYWVVKLDADGNKLWDKTFGGSKTDLLAVLRQTRDGGYVLAGYSDSNSSGDKTSVKRGGADFWLVKLDADGNQLWDKTYGGSKTDILTALQQTQDGGYVLGGYVPSGSDGDISGTNHGGWDYWVLKLDAAGGKQWDKTFGSSDQDLLSALYQTQDGGYVLGGSSFSGSKGDKSEDSQGGADYWVLKLDAAGNKQWDKTYGGNNTDRLAALQQVSDGSYILGGSSDSDLSGDKAQAAKGRTDYWVIKAGEDPVVEPLAQIRSIVPEKEVWGALITITGRHLATTTAVRFNGLDATFVVVNDEILQATVPVNATSGKITLVTAGGSVTSVSTFNVRHPGITAFTPDQGGAGTLVTMTGKRLATTREVYFGQVLAAQFQVLSDSSLVAVVPEGATTGKIRVVLTGGGRGSSKTQFLVTPAATADAKLARKESPAPGPPNLAATSLAAYPNPFRQQVTFRFSLPQSQPVVVKVYDLLGREVGLLYQGPVQAQQPYQVEWRPTPQQAGGLYFLRLQAPGHFSQQRVLLMR